MYRHNVFSESSMADNIECVLRDSFCVRSVVVENQSYLHAGHAGDDGSGNTHFYVRLDAAEFGSMSRVERHRAVYRVLDPFIKKGVHALKLDLVSSE